MAWPTVLTVDADVLKFIYEQGISRMLETGNDYTALHQGVAIEVRLWLENNGTPDADNVSNSTDFVAAAAHLFFAKLIKSKRPELSKDYNTRYLNLMRGTRVELTADIAAGGTLAKVVVRKQGQNHYTQRRSGALFDNYRR